MSTPPNAIDAFADRADYPLVVLTTINPSGERSGCLAGFITQCSVVPPRLLVCISKANHTFGVVRTAHLVPLHLLGERQGGLASRFGEQTGDRVDKFADIRWRPGPDGIPLLGDCAAWLVVELLDRFDVGDHQALLTAPTVGGPGAQSGLLTLRAAPPLKAAHPAE